MSKKRNVYIAAFDYVNKTFLALSASSSGIFIATFATSIGAPVGIASTSIILMFSFSLMDLLKYF